MTLRGEHKILSYTALMLPGYIYDIGIGVFKILLYIFVYIIVFYFIRKIVKYYRINTFDRLASKTSRQSIQNTLYKNMDISRNDHNLDNLEPEKPLGALDESFNHIQNCHICGTNNPTLYCKSLKCRKLFCTFCDVLYHQHPLRFNHIRVAALINDTVATEKIVVAPDEPNTNAFQQLSLNQTTQDDLNIVTFPDTSTIVLNRNSKVKSYKFNSADTGSLYDRYWNQNSSTGKTSTINNNATLPDHSNSEAMDNIERKAPTRGSFSTRRRFFRRRSGQSTGRKREEQQDVDEMTDSSVDCTKLTILSNSTVNEVEEEQPKTQSEHSNKESATEYTSNDTSENNDQELRVQQNFIGGKANLENNIVDTVVRDPIINSSADANTEAQDVSRDIFSLWPCTFCTFVNEAGVSICQVCAKSNPEKFTNIDLSDNYSDVPLLRGIITCQSLPPQMSSELVSPERLSCRHVFSSDDEQAFLSGFQRRNRNFNISTTDSPTILPRNNDNEVIFPIESRVRPMRRALSEQTSEELDPTNLPTLSPAASSDSVLSTWNCTFCTFVNQSDTNICLICSKTNPQKLKTGSETMTTSTPIECLEEDQPETIDESNERQNSRFAPILRRTLRIHNSREASDQNSSNKTD